MIPHIKSIEGKQVVWFQKGNKYVLTNSFEADTLLKICEGLKLSDIKNWCHRESNFTYDEACLFVESIQQLIHEQSEDTQPFEFNECCINSFVELDCKKYYKVFDTVFFVEYQSTELELLIHPKFSHLEIEETENYSSHFQIFKQENKFILIVDDEMIGAWDKANLHFLSGKFSMEFVNKMYKKKEDDWLGVFHASAIGDGESALMFAGGSGSGKSTICSILMSQGFNLIADDFVLLDKTSMINSFPAAISVKKTAWNILSKAYPDLIKEKEHEILKMNKTVKYLSPVSNSLKKSFPVKAIILVKFQSDVSCELKSIPKDEAFKELVPDSWLSPISENAEKFLDWFAKMPCYRLIYSDNQKMLSEVKWLFENEL